jgi:hypothetical protein
MCSPIRRLDLALVLAASGALVQCAGDHDESPSRAAKEALTVDAWKVIGAGDYNLDGMADVLWNNAGANTAAIWLMRGPHLLTPGPVIPGPLGDGWSALTPADFNLDGMADVPWSNPVKGTMATWLMNGTRLLIAGPAILGPVGEGWSAVTAADFNFDGSADMLWYNPTTSRMAVWLMAGPRLLLAGPELPTPAGAGWLVPTAADFNFDGMADVLWNNPGTNEMAVWLMSSTQVLTPGPVIPGPAGAGWTAVAAADFNLDGMADVIWSNSLHGSAAVWLMNATHVRTAGPEIPGPIGAGGSVAYAADFNLDGLADVIWQNPAPLRMTVWLMSGTHLLTPGAEIPGPALPGP